MENIQELNVGNISIKNIYFGFENMIPTKSKNTNKEIIKSKPEKNKKKSKKKKKSKSKEKLKQKNNDIIIKPIKNDDVNEEEKIMNNKKKSKKNSKQKKKKEIQKSDEEDRNIENENKEKKTKKKSKSKKKKKSKDKEIKSKKKKKSKSRSKKKENKSEGEQTTIKNINDDILDEKENQLPQYNEIKDDAMNEVDKHIHNLSLTFLKPRIIQKENNLSKTKLKIKKDNKRKSDSQIKNKNTINKEMKLIFTGNETINKRPYTAHGYKVKSKTKKLPKIIKKNNQEEEKIKAFKEQVYVHDKILSLFNNYKYDEITNKTQLSKTTKPKRINSALTKDTFHHYMMPKKKDILKLQKINKKEIEYNNDKYEDDPEEIKKDEKEENLIKNKNDKAIYLIKSSNKIYNKSQQSIKDIKNILNKNNIDTFMNNFLIKHNFTTKKEESKSNSYYDIPIIKYYHGGKKNIYANEKKQNKSDNDLLKNKRDKRYKLFNPKEIVPNPNNKFNFFNQTFTKEPIYGKYYEPPEIEKSINNNISTIPSNQFNPRYKLKNFVKEEKENPNDVYNYDYKYDDLNSDSDYELPNTDFKAKTAPKFKKIKFDYRNNKTGKLIKQKDENKEILKDNDENYLDKKIYHPFLINEDIVNI